MGGLGQLLPGPVLTQGEGGLRGLGYLAAWYLDILISKKTKPCDRINQAILMIADPPPRPLT